MLVPLTNQRSQVPRSKIVFRNDLVPDTRIFLDVRGHAHWRVWPGLDAECFGQSRPHAPSLKDIAISDIEGLIRGLGRLRCPDHHVGNKVCIRRFPDERWTAREAERFTLFVAN